jgi:hypothetical protein
MAQDQDMSDSPKLPSSGTKTTIRSTETLADNADIPNIEMGSFVTRDSGSKQRPNYGSTAHVPTKDGGKAHALAMIWSLVHGSTNLDMNRAIKEFLVGNDRLVFIPC